MDIHKTRVENMEDQLTATREKLAAYEAEAAKLRALTPEAVLEAQALLERLLTAAFGEDKTEPVKALDTLKLDRKRLRLAVLAARQVIESLDNPCCIWCRADHGEPHESKCRFLVWWGEQYDMLRHHGLVDAPKPDTEEAGE